MGVQQADKKRLRLPQTEGNGEHRAGGERDWQVLSRFVHSEGDH
jgi:hypothetical protein